MFGFGTSGKRGEPYGGPRIFRGWRRYRPETISLPDGRQVTLERPWSEYTIAELAALGITPEMGGGDSDMQVTAYASRPESNTGVRKIQNYLHRRSKENGET